MFRKILIGVLALVVVLAALIVVAVNVVDPNDYKDKIQAAAKQHGGVDLAIDGELQLSYFPWIGLSTGALSIAQPEGFGNGDMLAIDQADIKLKLLPLLSKEIIVSSIVLKGAAADLQRNSAGVANWESIGPQKTTAEPAETSQAESPEADNPQAGDSAISELSVGPVIIENASVRYRDDVTATDATISNVSIKTGAFTSDQPFSLSTTMNLTSDSAAIVVSSSSESEVTVDIANNRYSIAGLALDADLSGDAIGPNAIDLSLAGNVEAALAENKIDVSNLLLSALGVELSGNVAVNALDTEPLITGQLSSNTFSPAELLQQLGVPAIETADAGVLKRASVDLQLKATPAAATLDNVTLNLDDSKLSGKLNLPDLTAAMPPLRFGFQVDRFDADRYLPPASTDEADTDKPEAESQLAGNDAIELPTDLLRSLDLQGQFAINDFRAMNLQVNDIVIPVAAKAGELSAANVSAALYDGKIDSTAALNVQNSQPVYTVKFGLDAVQAEPLLQDLLQQSAPLAGTAVFSAAINTSGNSIAELKRALNGSINADFTDGAINGINIGYQLRRASALFSGEAASAQAEQVKTDFSTLHLGAQIENGVVRSNDLDMRAPALRLNGEGSVDLVQETVDYIAIPKVVGSAEGQGGADMQELKGLALNVPIRGSFQELSANFLGVMFDGLKNSYGDQVKQRAQALRDAEAEKLKAQANAKKAEAEARLEAERAAAEEQAKLKLQQQQEKLDAKADELKDKARDQLKSLFK